MLLLILIVGISRLSFAQFEGISTPLPDLQYSSAAFGDYDNDNDLDILLCGSPDGNASSTTTKIFRNRGDGTFEDSGISNLENLAYGPCAWGDYDNDGYLDIIISGYKVGGSFQTKIYHNNGNGTFVDSGITNIEGLWDGSVEWGDYDNDGDLDILLVGSVSTEPHTSIYQNKGNSLFTKVQIELPLIGQGGAKWGDYDNDGDLDILLVGYAQGYIYQNNGNGKFTDSKINTLKGFALCSIAWGDYDKDGYIDIALTGVNSSGKNVIKIFHNTQNGSFIDSDITLDGTRYSDIAWGDYDNDGYLDLIIMGSTYKKDTQDEIPFTQLYQNQKNGQFKPISTDLTSLTFGDVIWGDLDNDKDLDLLLTGIIENGNGFTKVFRNTTVAANQAPAAPTNLIASETAQGIKLSWTKSTDAQTLLNGITYNVSIGTTPQGGDILNSQANTANGFLKIADAGNAGQLNQYLIKNLPNGTYYWGVQAVDNSFIGSPFSNGGSFTVVDKTPPLINQRYPASNDIEAAFSDSLVIDFSEDVVINKGVITIYEQGAPSVFQTIDVQSVLISGNGTSRITIRPNTFNIGKKYYVVIEPGTFKDKAGNDFQGITETSTWSFTTPIFTRIAASFTGAYYSDTQWGDYDNDGDLDFIVSGTSPQGPALTKIYSNKGNDSFEDSEVNLPGLNGASPAWGDYDLDGDLDILLVGHEVNTASIKLYDNKGNGIFSESSISQIEAITGGSVKWGDYDNDGDLDILLMGTNEAKKEYVTKIYINNEDHTFTDSHIVLPRVGIGEAKWGDYDKDGDLDFVIIGDRNIAQIYRNDGNNQFTESGIQLTGGWLGDACWGDYNNDGYLDLVLTGSPDEGSITKVYKNKGNGSFEEETNAKLTAVSDGTVEWGDYDNDGKLDILISGYSKSHAFTQIYRNTGSGAFESKGISQLKVGTGRLQWGDYDNDGDLDILLTGKATIGGHTVIYKNETAQANTAPTAPTNLKSKIVGKDLILSWDKSADKETPPISLTYNVSLRKGAQAIAATHALNNGFRLVVEAGNANSNFYIIKNIPLGDYQWSVQSIDGAYAGSAFSAESNVSIKLYPPSNLKSTLTADSVAYVTWVDNSTNESGFVVERSLTKDFANPVSFQVSLNNAYYQDKGLKSNTNYYYRAKANLGALESFYSNIDSVKTPIITAVESELKSTVFVFPNPAIDKLVIRVVNPVKGNTIIYMTNIWGTKVLSLQRNKQAELLQETINLDTIAAGLYILEVIQGNQKERIKIIKL
ncbi:MAG: FG-GAP-like repeat-containing protein [Bacteroidota bacterium]